MPFTRKDLEAMDYDLAVNGQSLSVFEQRQLITEALAMLEFWHEYQQHECVLREDDREELQDIRDELEKVDARLGWLLGTPVKVIQPQ